MSGGRGLRRQLGRDLRRTRRELAAAIADLGQRGAGLKPGSAERVELWELLAVLRGADARIAKLLERENE